MQACGCGSKTRGALPDGARPGLHSEPLDATIRGCLRQFTPALGDYSLHIVPSATRATINSKMKMQHVLTLLAFSVAIAMWRYYTACIAWWRRFAAFIKATKRHHQTITCSDIIKGTHQLRLFQTFHHEKEPQLTCWPLITIGVWQIKHARST